MLLPLWPLRHVWPIGQPLSFDLTHIIILLNQYRALGPLPGFLLPVLEAFLPFLPLVFIIATNSAAYGLFWGFVLSLSGVITGSVLVFWIARKWGGRFAAFLKRTFPKSERMFHFIERRGFLRLFLLSCFPFSPSSLINLVSGMSTLPFRSFLIAVLMGKAIMIFLVSLLGSDITELVREPWRLGLAAVVLVLMWLIGRKLEARYHL